MSKVKFKDGDRVLIKSDCNSKGKFGTVTGMCNYPYWYDATYIIVKLDDGTSRTYNSKSLEKLNNQEEERKMPIIADKEWMVKYLGTPVKKEDNNYMNDRNLDAYSALMNGYLSMNILKDRNGSNFPVNALVKNKFDKSTIKDVIFNDPATIVLWKDGTKTVVKCQTETGDVYNKELGLAMCIIKKCCENKGNFNDVFNEWIKE